MSRTFHIGEAYSPDPDTVVVPVTFWAEYIELSFVVMPEGVEFNEDVNSSQGGRRPDVVSGSFAGPVSGERCRSESDKTSERQ